ncbi:MAG TPA: DUF885 domain-containing protein, partial [Acidimicrobiales bacterium]|nr:DUF885 domain-containing protein [Acidimicrobiales bacterium]
MADLDALIDEWIDNELEESPVRATQLGIDGYDDRLGDYSAEGFARRDRSDAAWLKGLDEVEEAGLSLDQRLDLGLLRAALRGRAVGADWAGWKRDPGVYPGVGLAGVFTLFLHRVHPEPELAQSAIARLREVPRVLAEGKANLDANLVAPLFVERATGSIKAGIGYMRSMVPAEVSDPALRTEVAEAGEVAAAALEDYLAFVEDLATRARGDWQFGEARYSSLLQDKELLGYGTSELHERGVAAYAALESELADVAERIAGTRDWRSVNKQLTEDHPKSPDDMRATYEEWTQKARQFLIDHELVTLADGERCEVVPSPPFQRPVLAVASYATPPAFKPTLLGHFFVPFPPDGTTEDEVQKRLASNSYHTIPTVAVHEAYPGHHWHLTWAQGNARKLRKMVMTPYVSEGWALYAERVMLEHGFFENDAQILGHLDARIFRAARIVVDTALHTGEMTFDEAVAHMTNNTALSEPTAKAEVGRYCAWPTQAPSYLTGCLEIERIRQ